MTTHNVGVQNSCHFFPFISSINTLESLQLLSQICYSFNFFLEAEVPTTPLYKRLLWITLQVLTRCEHKVRSFCLLTRPCRWLPEEQKLLLQKILKRWAGKTNLWGCCHALLEIPLICTASGMSLQHSCLYSSTLEFTVFLLFISQLITSPFHNLAGLQLLFWDLPTCHLQKQRRTMSSMALGAPSWRSSCLRQGHSLSKMSQPILSTKKMRRMQMKCIHKFHFHMLLSCFELWEITTKKKDRKHTCPRKGGYRMRTHTWPFLMVAIGQKRIFEKTVSYITDVTWLEQQKKTTGAVQVKRNLTLWVFSLGKQTLCISKASTGDSLSTSLPSFTKDTTSSKQRMFWPFQSSSPLCWALEGGKAIFYTLFTKYPLSTLVMCC